MKTEQRREYVKECLVRGYSIKQIHGYFKAQGVRVSIRTLFKDAEAVAEDLIGEAGMRFADQRFQRAVDLARINEAITSIQPKVAQGDTDAITALEKLLSRRERLLGHYKRTY